MGETRGLVEGRRNTTCEGRQGPVPHNRKAAKILSWPAMNHIQGGISSRSVTPLFLSRRVALQEFLSLPHHHYDFRVVKMRQSVAWAAVQLVLLQQPLRLRGRPASTPFRLSLSHTSRAVELTEAPT